MLLTLERLRIFVLVADRLHFTRAAGELGLTQSAVSAAIAALEGRTGIKLFHRIGRHVELTSEGASFLVEAKRVLLAARHAEEVLDGLSGLTRGHVSVMGSQTVAAYWLPGLLHRFRLRYPGIGIDLAIGNTAQVADAVRAGECEIGVVEGEAEDDILTGDIVAEDRLVLAVGADHAWAVKVHPSADMLQQLPWVLREPGSGTRAAALALLDSFGLSVTDVRVALELPSNESVRTAVESGAGACVLSTLVAESGLKAGTLLAVPCSLPARHFTLIRHRERPQSRASQAFVALMVEERVSVS